jgi:hypothetical protein
MDRCFDPEQERFTTIPVEAIGIPELPAMSFRYTVLELSTAVKPFFLEYLFRHHGCEKVCYFDPDIYFYAPIDKIWDLLDSHGMVLTPHLLGFLDDEHRPTELDILKAGAYNLGFIGLSKHPELDAFLSWWQAKLVRGCLVDFDRSLFVDQRWMDLAPSLFSSVHIHRDPACNVAYWNLNHRTLVRGEQGDYAVNGHPLKFFHFSGFCVEKVDIVSKHQDRFTLRNVPHLKSLFLAYRNCLLRHGYETAKLWPYSHNYHKGIRIPDIARTLWRELESTDPAWNPFGTTPDDQFLDRVLSWLNEPVDDGPAGQPPITRLALGIYQHRPDVQRILPDVLGKDRQQFAYWLATRGKEDHALDDCFVRAVTEERTTSLREWAKLSGRQRRVRLYYIVTNWLFRIGVGDHLVRKLGERRVSRVRQFLARTKNRSPVVSRPPPLTAPKGDSVRMKSDGE